jgi:hypothetical protein
LERNEDSSCPCTDAKSMRGAKPPPSHFFEQIALAAAEENEEYF